MIINNNVLKIFNHSNTSHNNYLIKLISVSAQTDTYLIVENVSTSPFYFEFDVSMWNLITGEYYIKLYDNFDDVNVEQYDTLTAFQYDRIDVINNDEIYTGHNNNVILSSFKL